MANVYKEPEKPLEPLLQLIRKLLGNETVKDKIRDNMYNNKKKL